MAVTVGAATYAYRPVPVPVPLGPVTATSRAPATPAGVTALIVVSLVTVKLAAATPPMVTAEAAVKLVPEIVTLVPPIAGPALGAMPVTVGVPT